MKKFFLSSISAVALLVLATGSVNAQVQTVLDGAYVKEHNATKRVVAYPHLREADVMWAHRVWRIVDLREKINHQLYFPIEEIEDRKSLFDVIKHALLVEGSLTAYGLGPTETDDEFRFPMQPTGLDSMLNTPVTNSEPIKSIDITQYKMKEDWVFDKQRSERYVRVIGIAPMMQMFGDDGESRGYKTLFWLYFPECRYVFANWDVFNLQNDAQRRTFEDIFQQRMFASYIVKESNVYNRAIADYANGMDELLESERIKNELFEVEHDLWHY
jgi:gliding motility associated protien GldN